MRLLAIGRLIESSGTLGPRRMTAVDPIIVPLDALSDIPAEIGGSAVSCSDSARPARGNDAEQWLKFNVL